MVARLAAARAAAPREALFINARIDNYLRGVRDFTDTVARAEAYLAAGADGIFVPGLDKLDEIGRFARAIDQPLNIYAGYPGVPSVAELASAGARRVSLGCGPLQSALGLLSRIADQTFALGHYDEMTRGMASAGELNRLFS
jgi:2-methylisocitrate lyase-like PEP mutase family enzyme